MSAYPLRGPAMRPAVPSRSSVFRGAGHALRTAVLSVLHALSTPVRFYRNRARFAEIARLTDHELADIGLTRVDVMDVTGLSTDQDPTSELARRAEQRRRRA